MEKKYNFIPIFPLILLGLALTNTLRADLNGLINPIFVTNTYTFTNGERADGFVAFVNGFDLPVGGTITLNLAPGCMIKGQVTMNQGTITAEAPVIFGPSGVSISGSGFFNIPSLILNSDFEIYGSIRCVGANMTMRGYGIAGLNLSQGNLDCSGISDNMNFDNIRISSVKNVATTSTAPRHFNLINTKFKGANEIVTIASPFIKIKGTCEIGTDKQGRLVFPGVISVERNSSLKINALSRIQVGGILLQESDSTMILENAQLTFNNTNSTGASLAFANIASSSAGSILVIGNSVARTTGSHKIIVPKAVDLMMAPAARLQLNTPLHLSVE